MIVVDLAMPAMGGAKFRARMLRDEALRDIPVVVLSGSDEGDVTSTFERPARLATVRLFVPEPRSTLSA